MKSYFLQAKFPQNVSAIEHVTGFLHPGVKILVVVFYEFVPFSENDDGVRVSNGLRCSLFNLNSVCVLF